ncbi:MAG TPA: LPS export ABC transporter periplasmic protein LptC [Methylomicrobium sp.]|nr:LPS export ABC transporter periplasmic protein LptC [Methylomicrobium sp.]
MLALLSWGLVKLTVTEEAVLAVIPPHSPDLFSTGYTKWEMAENGSLKSKLIADRMTHYSDDGTTHLDKPLMFFHNETTPPWVVKAEAGILSADGKDLKLNGKVLVERAQAPGVKPLIINTSNLKVKPETHYAETDEWAELISVPNRTTGIGMKLVFEQPIHLQLLSKVKGKYETK